MGYGVIMTKGGKCVTNRTSYCDSHATSPQLSYPVGSFLVKSTNFQEIKKMMSQTVLPF